MMVMVDKHECQCIQCEWCMMVSEVFTPNYSVPSTEDMPYNLYNCKWHVHTHQVTATRLSHTLDIYIKQDILMSIDLGICRPRYTNTSCATVLAWNVTGNDSLVVGQGPYISIIIPVTILKCWSCSVWTATDLMVDSGLISHVDHVTIMTLNMTSANKMWSLHAMQWPCPHCQHMVVTDITFCSEFW